MQAVTIDVMTTIYSRRAIRAFSDEPVSADAVDQLIDAAVQAPSSMGLEPWAFIVVEGAAKLKEFSDRAKRYYAPHGLSQSGGSRVRAMLTDPNLNIFHDAPTLIVVCAVNDLEQSVEDCNLAAENLMLAAHAAGLGTCPIGFSRPWLRLPETKTALRIPRSMFRCFLSSSVIRRNSRLRMDAESLS